MPQEPATSLLITSPSLWSTLPAAQVTVDTPDSDVTLIILSKKMNYVLCSLFKSLYMGDKLSLSPIFTEYFLL